MSEDYALKPGDRCGPYRLAYALDQGGFSEVHVGVDEDTHQIAAIKVLQTGRGQSEEFQERFALETRLLAKLDHENIVQFYGAGYEEGRLWMAMELLRGQSLRKHLHEAGGKLPIEEALRIAYEAACGLAQAQGLGIVHRDIKPENIFCTEAGAVKMLDFGIAKAAGSGGRSTGRNRRGSLGTPSYMSPEQIQGEVPEFTSDVYQLGVVLYEMLTGRHPFAYRNGELPKQAQLFELQLGVMPRPLTELSVPEEIWRIVERALWKDPRDRWPTMRDFGVALWDALRAVRAEARESGGAYDQRNPASSDGQPLGAGARRAYQPARTPPGDPSPSLPSGSVRLRSDVAAEIEQERERDRAPEAPRWPREASLPDVPASVPMVFARTVPLEDGASPASAPANPRQLASLRLERTEPMGQPALERTTLPASAPDPGRAPAWLAVAGPLPSSPASRMGARARATSSIEPVIGPVPRSANEDARTERSAVVREPMPGWLRMLVTVSASICLTITGYRVYLDAEAKKLAYATQPAPPPLVSASASTSASAVKTAAAVTAVASASAGVPAAPSSPSSGALGVPVVVRVTGVSSAKGAPPGKGGAAVRPPAAPKNAPPRSIFERTRKHRPEDIF
jgi:serine/threonine protein kinase